MSDCNPHDFTVDNRDEYGLSMSGRVHVAGRFVENSQTCSRCGRLLIDGRKLRVPRGATIKGFNVDALVTEREVKLYDGTIHRAMTLGAAKGAVPCMKDSK